MDGCFRSLVSICTGTIYLLVVEGYGHDDQGHFELSIEPQGRHLVPDGDGYFKAMEDPLNRLNITDRYFITKVRYIIN